MRAAVQDLEHAYAGEITWSLLNGFSGRLVASIWFMWAHTLYTKTVRVMLWDIASVRDQNQALAEIAFQ